MGKWIHDVNFKKESTEMKDLPKVTFGIINCNRLHYLKSCLESLVECTSDYPNKEIIVVDNASVENGTDEYLSEKESEGIIIHRMKNRDPNNEFAKALNTISRQATGEFIAPIQGDMQFVLRGGWLEQYVKFYSQNIDNIGCIMLDAQRTSRIKNQSKFSDRLNDEFPFFYDLSRIPFCCSADVMYSRQSLDFMGEFLEANDGHETGVNSEDDMRKRILATLSQVKDPKVFCAMPKISPAVAIITDPRGTNARVRNNRRYGDYWEAKEGFSYYKIQDFNDVVSNYESRNLPVGIEEAAIAIGWDLPIDQFGNWKKNPIRIDSAVPSDWEEIGTNTETINVSESQAYLDEWMLDE